MLRDSEFRSPLTPRSFDGADGSCRCIGQVSMRQALFFASCASRSPVRMTEIPFPERKQPILLLVGFSSAASDARAREACQGPPCTL